MSPVISVILGVGVVLGGISLIVYLLGAWLGRACDEARDPRNW